MRHRYSEYKKKVYAEFRRRLRTGESCDTIDYFDGVHPTLKMALNELARYNLAKASGNYAKGNHYGR